MPQSAAILLVTINAKWIHPSLALRLLKANLRDLENLAEIQEYALRQPLQEKLEPIAHAQPRILGISVSIWNHKASLELLEALEDVWLMQGYKPAVVVGGPEVSHIPPDSEIFRYVDWVVQGEGEDVFHDLCHLILDEYDSLSKISKMSISFAQKKFQDKIARFPSVKNISGKFIRSKPVDLATIDPGYRLYTDEDLCRKLTYVEASRVSPAASSSSPPRP
jgi:radical SAM superfamily enzyme YgiQ (UPF0313 family)